MAALHTQPHDLVALIRDNPKGGYDTFNTHAFDTCSCWPELIQRFYDELLQTP